MDEAMLDSEAAMARFLDLIAGSGDRPRPVMIDSSRCRDRGRAPVRAGKAIVKLALPQGGRAPFLARRGWPAGMRRRRRHAFDEQARPTAERKSRFSPARTGCS